MIHFLLTPDTASALKLRRMVATAGGRTDVLVGTWPELLQQARTALCCHPRRTPGTNGLWVLPESFQMHSGQNHSQQ